LADVIIVGAGVIGASTAFHLAERGSDVLILDRDGPSAGSTARSAALVRAHYPTALEADLAWESLTDYFEHWGERVGGGCGFTRTGFAFLASQEDEENLRANVAMLSREIGLDTVILEPGDLENVDPALATDGVAVAAHEPRGGYADPSATTLGFLRAAEDLGARFERRRVESLVEREGRISGVETEEGVLEARTVVLCAGAPSVPLAASVGLDLPIRPARVQVALFERPYSLSTHLTTIDSVYGISFRPTADRCTLVSMRLPELEWLQSPDEYAPGADDTFVKTAASRISRRIPALREAPYRLGWAGVVDVTPDGRPVLGPEGPEGLYLSVGWSGTGFKKAPAVGAELARWMDEGAPKRNGLESYSLERFEKGDLISGKHEYGVKSPH
jgi:sarcosine oxidase, subunit beta